MSTVPPQAVERRPNLVCAVCKIQRYDAARGPLFRQGFGYKCHRCKLHKRMAARRDQGLAGGRRDPIFSASETRRSARSDGCGEGIGIMLSDNGFHAGALARGALLAVVLGLAAASAAQANDPWIVAQRQADPSANPARESWMPVSRQAAGAREDRDSTGPFNPAPEESQPDAAAAGCAPAGDTPPPDAPSDR